MFHRSSLILQVPLLLLILCRVRLYNPYVFRASQSRYTTVQFPCAVVFASHKGCLRDSSSCVWRTSELHKQHLLEFIKERQQFLIRCSKMLWNDPYLSKHGHIVGIPAPSRNNVEVNMVLNSSPSYLSQV